MILVAPRLSLFGCLVVLAVMVACAVKGYAPPVAMFWQGQPVRLLYAIPDKPSRWTVRPGSIVCKRVGTQVVRVPAGQSFVDTDDVAGYVGGCIAAPGVQCDDASVTQRFGVRSATNYDPVKQCFLDTDLPNFFTNKCVKAPDGVTIQVFDDVPAEMGGPNAIPCPPVTIFD